MTASDRSEPKSVQSFSTPEEHALVYAAVIHSAIDAVIVADEAGLVVATTRPPRTCLVTPKLKLSEGQSVP